jgi:purine-binding chemotaxis protein CheW
LGAEENVRDRGGATRRVGLGRLVGNGARPDSPEDGQADAAALPLVVFTVDGQRYAIPLAATERVLPMVALARIPDAPEIALAAVNVHGQVFAVLDVRRRLGLPPRELGPSARLLVATTQTRTVALAVDEVLGVEEVPADEIVSPEAVLPGRGLVAGIALFDDGLALIHDLDAFLTPEEDRSLQHALEAASG